MKSKVYWAYFRRWLYLLFCGMWRGEQAYTVWTPWELEIKAGKNFTEISYEPTRCFYSGPNPDFPPR